MNDPTTHGMEPPGYRLLRPIGSSGAATVYVAIQRSLAREVAVKVFRTMDAAASARFEQLLRANARLSHHNIVNIHQIGRGTDERLYHSMPLLLGAASARRRLRLRPLKVAAVVRELLDALAYAHQQGVVHGGIKPSNVLFDPRGRAKLADFGIARCAAELALAHPDAARYLSPEQLRGEPAAPASDLYSLGAVTCELLTGAPPFAAPTAAERRAPALPPAARSWQAWVDKALAESPQQRFQSAREMADAVAAIDGIHARGGAVRAAAHTPLPKWALAIPVVIVALAVGVWAIWGLQPVPAARVVVAPPIPMVPLDSGPAVVPAAALPAPASTVSPLVAQIQSLLTEADALRAGGHAFAPSGDNALEKYLTVLGLDHANAPARAGIDGLLGRIRKQVDADWRKHKIADLTDLLSRADLLAKYANARAGRRWHKQRDALARDVGTAMAGAANARDLAQFDALQPLANAMPAVFPAGFDPVTARQRAATPLAGTVMRDRDGPALIYVPASGKTSAYALGRTNVTRADYAAFVQATHRPTSRCLEAYNPFSRLRHLTWQDPGFKQTGSHPVVCVSWSDATAYAAWLSGVTGEPYRLASDGQWLRAAQGVPKLKPCQLGNVDDTSRHSAFDGDQWDCDDGAENTAAVGSYAPSALGVYGLYGNVSAWLAGGSARERRFRGLSWRDGSRQKPLGRSGTAKSNVGYTNVGFRVVRLIDSAHPAPPAVHGK